MLRIVQTGVSLPASWPVDPTAEFESGMIAQLKTIGNDIVVGVSDGTAPLGIIDDVRTSAFTKTQIDEVVEISVTNIETDLNGQVVNTNDEFGFLEYPSLLENSFTSTITVYLNPVNGVITVPAGTPLNFDFDGDGVFDGFKIVTSYVYRIPNRPGDDTTFASGRVTVHYARGFYATDQFDTLQQYPLNVTLYVGLDGKLTSKQPTSNHPGIAIVTGPPTSTNGTLEFLFL
jgi:hypothetical protein